MAIKHSANRLYKNYAVCLVLFLLTILAFALKANAQFERLPYVETMTFAKEAGVAQRVGDIYKSAIIVADTSKGVFKTDADREPLTKAYTQLLNDFGKYLKDHNFKWEQPTRCWNRIYFSPDGAIDYYLFDFKTNISNEKLKQYRALFTSFAGSHKINITAQEGFAQCSPVTFMDK